MDWPTDDLIINVHGVSHELHGYTFVGYRYTVMERTEEEIQADPGGAPVAPRGAYRAHHAIAAFTV